MDLKQFLAKQLNDHSESPSGVIQKTFYEWTESHVSDAIELSLCYLYSLIPQEFSKIVEYEVQTADCVIDFCSECNKFMGMLSVEVNGKKCIELEQSSAKTNSLSSLLDIRCANGGDDHKDKYMWDYAEGSSCVVVFDEPLPSGAKVRYLCSSPPSIDDMDDAKMCEYLSLIADYALWWLFRTDSESRSNLDRAKLHFQGVQFFVTTKLLVEFSLKEDDYTWGRRKVDD